MSWVPYIIGGLVGLLVVFIAVYGAKKSAYGKAVYQELDHLPEGRALKDQITNHPDE